jgi:hypothetical protein
MDFRAAGRAERCFRCMIRAGECTTREQEISLAATSETLGLDAATCAEARWRE